LPREYRSLLAKLYKVSGRFSLFVIFAMDVLYIELPGRSIPQE